MHPALAALERVRDRDLSGMGFDRARDFGVLGSYMQMMNRGKSGGYRPAWIVAAKIGPGKDPLPKATRPNQPF